LEEDEELCAEAARESERASAALRRVRGRRTWEGFRGTVGIRLWI
jgi:hypothetical protein